MELEGRYEPPTAEVDAAEDYDLDDSGRSRRKRRKRPAPGKVTRTLSMDALPAFVREWGSERAREVHEPAHAPVQADGGRVAAMDPFAVHLVAREGVAGHAATLPHLEAIQRAFGHHDVSGVRAHVGGAAADAADAIGARAYATGDDIAFATSPDVRQAAHEAAHIVQQRAGVRLEGGVGATGDVYEQHADAVAELVVRGESAEALLDAMGPAGGVAADHAVQRQDGEGGGRRRRGRAANPALRGLTGITVAQLVEDGIGLWHAVMSGEPMGVPPSPYAGLVVTESFGPPQPVEGAIHDSDLRQDGSGPHTVAELMARTSAGPPGQFTFDELGQFTDLHHGVGMSVDWFTSAALASGRIAWYFVQTYTCEGEEIARYRVARRFGTFGMEVTKTPGAAATGRARGTAGDGARGTAHSAHSAPVQRKGGSDAADPEAARAAAARGVAGSGGALPHLATIQAAFGKHDVSSVRAHVGGAAADAAGALGASAYATGNDIAFADTPDLRIAAHEAAHIVQQRRGAALDGGLGRTGDAYEQHADAVADAVVRGESAEALLDDGGTCAGADTLGIGAMGRATGEDFSDVEVRLGDVRGSGHGARAVFEGGRDVISFDEAAPRAEQVAHELVHVAQRRRFGEGSGGVATADSAPEVEARELAPRLAAGHVVEVNAAPSGRVHLDDEVAETVHENLNGWIDDESAALRALRGDSDIPGTIAAYQRLFHVKIWTDFQDNASGSILHSAMALLWPHMSLVERLETMTGVDDDEAGILQTIQNASDAECMAAREDIQPYLDELEVPDQFTARQRIWPERALQNVIWLLRNADHWFFDDEGPGATAIMNLTSTQRADLWNNHRDAFAMFSGDPDDTESDLGRIRRMCVGADGESAVTDDRAIEARMELATVGSGTDEEGALAAVGAAGSRRDELAEIDEAIRSGQGANGAPLTATQIEELEQRRDEIGDVGRLLTASEEEDDSGTLDDDTFLGRLAGDVDPATLDAALATAHTGVLERTKQALLGTENWMGDVDEDAVRRILHDIPGELTLAEGGSADGLDAEEVRRRRAASARTIITALRADDDLDHIFGALDMAEEIYVDNLESADGAVRAIDYDLEVAFEGIDTDETAILQIIRDAPPEVRAVLDSDDAPPMIDRIRRWAVAGDYTDFLTAFDHVLATGEIDFESALDEALGNDFDGTNVELVNEALGGMSAADRAEYRRGYLVLHSEGYQGDRVCAPLSEAQERDRRAVERYMELHARLETELSAQDLDAALVRLLDIPTVEEMVGEDGSGRLDAAAIMLHRQQERLELNSPVLDLLTTTDDTAAAAHVEFEARYNQALDDGDISAEEFQVLIQLDTRFNERFTEYSATADLVSEIAGTVAAVVAAAVAIAVSAGTLTAASPGVIAWLSANSSIIGTAAAAGALGQVAGSELAGGDFNEALGADGARQALSGAVNGALVVCGAALAEHAATLVGLSGPSLSSTIARIAAGSIEEAVRGRNFARAALMGLIDGSLGGAVGELAMTLTDAQTWRHTVWDVLARAGAALLRGGLLGGVTGAATSGLVEIASTLLAARALRGVAVQMDEVGSRIHIRADVTAEGALDNISLHFGPDTSEADIAAHIERIVAMRRASTLLGRARRALTGMRRAVDGSEAGHAFHEAEKIPQMIDDRLRQLANPELSGADRDVLESEIDMLESNLDHFSRVAREGSTAPGTGSGTIARPDAPNPDYPAPPPGHYYRQRGEGWDLQRLPDGDDTIEPQTLVRDGTNPNGSPRFVVRPRSEVSGRGPVTRAVMREDSDIADDAFAVEGDADEAMRGIARERLAEIEARDTASRELATVRASLGLSEADTSSTNIDTTLARLRGDPAADQALVEELARLRGALRDARRDLNRASELLGNTAAQDVMRARGARHLWGDPTPPGRPGQFDFIYVTRDANNQIDGIFVVEAKGASSSLGTAEFDGVAREQGSRAYLEGIARSMRTDEETTLNGVLDTIINRPPDGPEVRYILVQAPVDGNGMPLPPRVSEFDIGP
ncbi:MAG TPA: DUF4157 domain-containing protein [Kofleriaceae bacterium]|nr:DUF4157 domain-containing protein [Kofleriaceae bacterium]